MKLNEALEIIKEATFVEDGEHLLNQTEKERQQTLALFRIFDAIKRGELVPNRWIPVSVRLPEEKINPITKDFNVYPCTVRFGDVYDVRYYKFGRNKWWDGAGRIDKVIAWMPFPEPYKENKEE